MALSKESVMLDISRLNEVEKALVASHFPKSKWLRLGLTLGLYKPSLDAINSNHKGDVDECLLRCLSLWLQKADNVRLSPSWVTLASGLLEINEVAVSEKIVEIKKQITDPACQLLQKYSDQLSQVTLSIDIIKLLYTEKIISKETLDQLAALGHLLNGSMRALCTTVYRDNKKLQMFASILLRSENTIQLGTDIINDYDQIFQVQTFVSSLNRNTSSGSVEIVLERDEFQAEFDRVNDSLGTMIFNVAPFIETTVPSLEHLISYLRTIRPELRPQLSLAKSFDDVRDIIRDNCSITNIVLLEDIVKQYSVTEAEELISKYNSGIEDFCTKQVSNIKLKKLSSSLLTCDTIIFIVNWEVTRCTLNNIKDLLQRAFRSMYKKIEVIETSEGHSILITCYAPHHLMDLLLVIAQENIEELKSMGLIQLTIGYYTVYNKHEEMSLHDMKVVDNIFEEIPEDTSPKSEGNTESEIEVNNQQKIAETMSINDGTEREMEEIELLQEKITTQHSSLLEKEETIHQLRKKADSLTGKLNDYQKLNHELNSKLQDIEKIKRSMSMELDKLTQREQEEGMRQLVNQKEKAERAVPIELEQLKAEKEAVKDQLRSLIEEHELLKKISESKEKKILELEVKLKEQSLSNSDDESNDLNDDTTKDSEHSSAILEPSHKPPSVTPVKVLSIPRQPLVVPNKSNERITWNYLGSDEVHLFRPTVEDIEHVVAVLKQEKDQRNITHNLIVLFSSSVQSTSSLLSQIQLTAVGRLWIYYSPLNEHCVQYLHNIKITQLVLYNCPITDIKPIHDFIQVNTTIPDLRLFNEELTDNDLRQLLDSLTANKTTSLTLLPQYQAKCSQHKNYQLLKHKLHYSNY